MNKQDFLGLEFDDQYKYLSEQAAKGKSFNEMSTELGLNKEEFGKLGFYFIKDKWMRKPMKGYQTTQRSGNEYKDRFK